MQIKVIIAFQAFINCLINEVESESEIHHAYALEQGSPYFHMSETDIGPRPSFRLSEGNICSTKSKCVNAGVTSRISVPCRLCLYSVFMMHSLMLDQLAMIIILNS